MGEKKRAWPLVIMLFLSLVLLVAVFFIRLPYLSGLISSYKNSGNGETITLEIERVLFRNGEEELSPASIAEWNRDSLHLAAEAALIPPSKEETAAGFISYIPHGTELIGIAERDGYIFINLTDEMKKAPEEAFTAIADTIRNAIQTKAITFLINGEEVLTL